MLHRRVVREEMLQDLSTNNNCRKIIRMSVEAFKILCQKLENECGLRPTQRAIDGTHVRVRVPNRDTPIYRGRKGYPTINVFVACTFDLKFTYVLSGWEGTASDSRIVKDALTRDDKLIIPNDRDKELEDEVIDEMLAASHDEEPHGPRDTDDRGEQIRNSIANDMWKKNRQNNDQQAETVEEIDHLFENNVINLDNIGTSDDIHVISPTPQSYGKLPTKSKSKRRKVIENSHPHVYTEGKIYEELTCLVLERKDIHTAYAYLLENLVKTRGLFGCLIEHILFYLKAIMGLGDSEDSKYTLAR
ncbi:putative nuclease HARBI1 [Tanacetum coccineum]